MGGVGTIGLSGVDDAFVGVFGVCFGVFVFLGMSGGDDVDGGGHGVWCCWCGWLLCC